MDIDLSKDIPRLSAKEIRQSTRLLQAIIDIADSDETLLEMLTTLKERVSNINYNLNALIKEAKK